jgi:hypothetical protein
MSNSSTKTTTETGAEELRRIVSCLNSSTEGAVDDFTAEEVIRIVRACWSSPWDIWPDNLTDGERKYAAKHGALSKACCKRLDREMS